MARLSGELAQIKLIAAPGTPVAFNKTRQWNVNRTAITVDAGAAGDTVEQNKALRTRHVFTATVVLEDTEPYGTLAASVGAAVAWVAMLKAAHTNGLFSSTGILNDVGVPTPWNDLVTVDIEIIPDGTALTIDESPT
jgi:hypothetical protein